MTKYGIAPFSVPTATICSPSHKRVRKGADEFFTSFLEVSNLNAGENTNGFRKGCRDQFLFPCIQRNF